MTSSDLRKTLRVKSFFNPDPQLSTPEQFRLERRRKNKWIPLVLPGAQTVFDAEAEAKTALKKLIEFRAEDLKDKRHAPVESAP